MRGAIFFLIYIFFTSTIVSASSIKTADEIIFLPNENNNFLQEVTERPKQKARGSENIQLINQETPQKAPTQDKDCVCSRCKLHFNPLDRDCESFFKKECSDNSPGNSHSGENVIDVYSDGNLDIEKNRQEFERIKEKGLENTVEGIINKADSEMILKHYNSAAELYKKALEPDCKNRAAQMKLAFCYRKIKYYNCASSIYKNILESYPDFIDAKINLAYLELDRGKYDRAIQSFQKLLSCEKDNKDIKMGLAYSLIAARQNLSAIDLLKTMSANDDEVRTAKSSVYYAMGMYSDAKDALEGHINKNNVDLANNIKKARAFTFIPSYTFLDQELNDAYDLDIRKVGITMSEYGSNNIKYFLDYGMYVYLSGNYFDNHLDDFTNEIRSGAEGRPTEKFAFRSDIGVKIFREGWSAMINTDSWLKYYHNDAFSCKLGFVRNNIEQSYLMAVGFPINGVFKGRGAFNKAYIEIEGQFPSKWYYNFKGGGGIYTAQQLPTNAFIEGTLTVGKNVYNNPENKWIQTASLEFVSYNTSFQFQMVNIPGALPPQNTFGGYFSPSFYTANTLNFKVEGEKKERRIKYGLKGFIGPQFEFTPDLDAPVYGISPYMTLNLNDHVSVNLSYIYSNYATLLKHFFMISVEIKGFGKIKLPKNNKITRKDDRIFYS